MKIVANRHIINAWRFGIETADLLTDYAAAFLYNNEMYIYIDANRTYDHTDSTFWDNFDIFNEADNNPDYESLGLSNGDILIKMAGIHSVSDIVSDYELNMAYVIINW